MTRHLEPLAAVLILAGFGLSLHASAEVRLAVGLGGMVVGVLMAAVATQVNGRRVR